MNHEHRIIRGDARRMSLVEDKSVHLAVTSPPYWQLKDYGSADQIGFDSSYEEYINNLNLVWTECYRVLHDGCRLCVNVGDQFARAAWYGRYKVIPIRTEIIRFCETVGFDFMGSIIWQKVTTCNSSGGGSVMGSYPYPRNGIVRIDYEFILLFKKAGTAPKVNAATKEQSKLTAEQWNDYFSGHWNFPGVRQSDHLAAFPMELPSRLIRMFSFVGEIVLDPFLGSGTSSLAAAKNERRSIGYEINEQFVGNAVTRMQESSITVTKEQDSFRFDWTSAVKPLPYRFVDPVSLNSKAGVKKHNFGSRVSMADKPKVRPTHKVVEVISGDCLLLEDGRQIRLHGIKIKEDYRQEGINYLNEIVKGQWVELRFEEDKYCTDKTSLTAYLYLKNKTFINAHLVKRGLAEVDDQQPVTNRSLLKLVRKDPTMAH